jgi:hypothetical protein
VSEGLVGLRLAVAVVLALLGWARPAAAVTVAIVRPPEPTPVMSETLIRIAGELTAIGFAIELVEARPVAERGGDRESRLWLEQLARQHHVDAVVALIGATPPDAIEVWIVDGVTGKSVVRRVPFEPTAARAPETLSIRAIELLRSSFLELEFAARAAPGEPQPTPEPIARLVAAGPSPRAPERAGLEVGAVGVFGLDGIGPAVLPMVRLQWAARSWLLVQATLAGLGTRSKVSTAAGSAEVAQGYALLGVALRLREGERLRPFVAAAAGMLHTGVEGRPESPNRGRSVDQWSFLAEAGGGASLRLRNRFQLSLAACAQLAEPYPAVSFVGTDVATSARPNLLVSLSVGAWL